VGNIDGMTAGQQRYCNVRPLMQYRHLFWGTLIPLLLAFVAGLSVDQLGRAV
jgi:hypothetical protein